MGNNLADGISWFAASAGTGTFVFSSSRPSFLTLAQAVSTGALTDGQQVSYLAQDSLSSPTQREWGHGTFSSGGNSVARTTVLGGTSGPGVHVNFTAPPLVSLTVLAEDINFGNINIGSYVPLVADGLTDNLTAFQTFAGQGFNSGDAYGGVGVCKTIGKSLATVVTLTLASPGVVNWTGHGLRVNETVVFATTGALPTGLVAGTPYYVMYANLTANSFQVSAQNAIVNQTGDGPAINFTGSQSGTQYARTEATDWQDVVLLPGAYFESGNCSINGGQRKLRFHGYGVIANNISFAAILSFAQGTGGYFFRSNTSALVENTAGNPSIPTLANTITLINIADVSKFWIGGWIVIAALDMQDSLGAALSAPPNNHYFEFVQVTAINAGTGVLTFISPLRFGYSNHFPTFYDGSDGVQPSGGGPATIWPMSPEWDMEQEILGFHITNLAFQTVVSARRTKFIDCQFDGQGPVPSVTQSFVMENCVLTQSGNLEIDKLVEYLKFENTDFTNGGIQVPSSSVDRLIVRGCRMASINGTARLTHVADSFVSVLSVGCTYGASEQLLLENVRATQIQELIPIDETLASGSAEFNYCVNNWTFSNGKLTQPLVSTAGNQWAVPGRKMYINDMTTTFDSMGAPFMVLDVYQGQAASSTVTIDIATPAVIHWTSHGRSAGDVIIFRTTGALPTGLLTNFPYYVLAAGLTANTFEVSTAPAGSPVNTSGSQSGTQTAFANPTFNVDTTLASLPAGISTTSTVTIDIATPALIHWTTHGLTAGTPVIFQTTGALPTGLSASQIFYVIAAGLTANAFEVSTSVGGSAVNTSGSQSGTQTAIANPLKFKTVACPSVTVRNCAGTTHLGDLNNGPQNSPLWSFASRKFAGYVDTNPVFLKPPMFVRGYLVSFTINVEQAYTGSGACTYTISAPAFNSSLVEADMSFVINAKIAGIRVITPSAATGAQSGDTITAFANWLSAGPNGAQSLTITPSNNSGSLAQQPIASFTIITDQGDIDPIVWQAGSNISDHSDQIIDTTSYHGYV
jgi:hypothetical protein